MTTKKKPAPKAPAKQPGKTPSPAVIKNTIKATGSNGIVIINRDLARKGYARINAARRDEVLGKIENNQKPAKDKRSANGGARKGSGRKKGAATTKTREIADQLASDGLQTPLEYMLEVMRTTDEDLKKKHDTGEIDTETYLVKLQANMARRDNFAEKAAPYIHPRLASIQAKFEGSEHDRWVAMMEEANQS